MKMSPPWSFGCGYNAHTVLTQGPFIKDGVISVTGESVKLPHDNHIERFVGAVFDHFLKIGTVIRLRRICTVYVCAHDLDAVFVGKCCVFADLSLD